METMDRDIDIQRFEWDDLETVTRLFNSINGAEGTGMESDAELMRQILAQPSVSPEDDLHVAYVGTDMVGFYLLYREIQINRVVATGGVLAEFRGRGIGRLLLRTAIEQVEDIGAGVLHIQTSVDAQDACHLLESEGFERVKDYWQMRWDGDDLPSLALRPGFQLKPFSLGRDEAMLTELQNAAFGEHWGFCPNTVEEIAARVRMKIADPDGIIFVMDGSRPAGYNWTLRYANRYGKIGVVSMTGVHPSYRGNGLGTAVVVSGMQYLKDQGVDAIELEVDSENTPARELYLKLGYRQVSRSVWYERRFR